MRPRSRSRSRSRSRQQEAYAPSLTRSSSHSSNEIAGPIPSLDHEAAARQQAPPHDNQGDFTYEVLTFETSLPHYITTPQPSLPPPPDLTKYESPFHWSHKRKNIVVAFCCLSTFNSAYSVGAYSIAADQLRSKWPVSSVVFNLGVTVWAASFAYFPMILAPFSEINGRRPVFLGSGMVMLIAILGCAVTDSFAGMLVARFFNGVGSSTFATVCGGVISDIFHTEQRNTPMAIFAGCALFGTAFGPLICGFIVSRVSWRWVFYHQVIALSFTMVLLLVLFTETRGSVLLARRCAAINKYLATLDSLAEKPVIPGYRPNFRYQMPPATTSSLGHMIYLSLTIPFRLLVTEPVIFFFSLWISFAWALQYMTFSVIPMVFTATYNFDTQSNGAVFSSICVGSIIATTLSVYQERLAKIYWPKFNSVPEGRLYFSCLESALLPIGLFWFGWTVTPSSHIHWISPALALACIQIGIFSIYLAVFNYLADVYHRYASSALAGQNFCRNMLAAVFPLFADQMFKTLGFGPASSLLGGIAVALTAVPWVLVFFGESIRRKSKIASEIMQDEVHAHEAHHAHIVQQQGTTETSEKC